jgi:hypothetical protein
MSVREDLTLLIDDYLPEILVVSLLVIVSWALRKLFSRNARSIS